jgi:hypothetical protein
MLDLKYFWMLKECLGDQMGYLRIGVEFAGHEIHPTAFAF